MPVRALRNTGDYCATVGSYSGRKVARHERCHCRRQHVLDLEHYLDVLSHKPVAFAGCKPQAQWREAGR